MTPEEVSQRLDTELENLVTKDHLDLVIGRLENKLDARFNAVDARLNAVDAKFNGIEGRFNAQRNLIIIAIITVAAQIVNAWILHAKP